MSRKRRKSPPPLPPRDGLGASRVRVPDAPIAAGDFLTEVIKGQRHRHPDDDAAAVLQRFAVGEVVLRDGTPLSPNDILQPGTDVFFYRRPAPETPVPFTHTVMFEDDNVLVVNKPPFLATMPRAAHITETLTVRLRRETDNEELTPAHRLDRMTSGLLLLTKRRDVRGAYQDMFARREVRRLYSAVAPYDPSLPAGPWRHHIVKEHGEIASKIVRGAEPNSETLFLGASRLPSEEETVLQERYGVEGPLGRYLLEPISGRTHQLRIQMLDAGVPIIGDSIYPVPHPFGEDDFTKPMLLECISVAFTDPLSSKAVHFTTDPSVPWP